MIYFNIPTVYFIDMYRHKAQFKNKELKYKLLQ